MPLLIFQEETGITEFIDTVSGVETPLPSYRYFQKFSRCCFFVRRHGGLGGRVPKAEGCGEIWIFLLEYIFNLSHLNIFKIYPDFGIVIRTSVSTRCLQALPFALMIAPL